MEKLNPLNEINASNLLNELSAAERQSNTPPGSQVEELLTKSIISNQKNYLLSVPRVNKNTKVTFPSDIPMPHREGTIQERRQPKWKPWDDF
jgi:hypothetical protein